MAGKIKGSALLPLAITKVISGGQEVTSGGVTFSPRANFSVNGPSDSLLQLVVDDGAKYSGQTNNAGNGFFLIDNLPEGKHEYVLTHGEEETEPFILTSVVTKPFIERLEDSNGTVENGGQTEDTDLKIKGLAKTGQIRIFNGAATAPIATFAVNPDRTWDGSLTLVTGEVYALKAKADDRTESDIYTVTIGEVSEVEVKITSLKDSEEGEIEDGGTTTDTTLTISGTATDGEVKLLDGDNATPIETFTAAEGTWGGEIELTAGKTYVLKAEDADGEKSETHTVIVSEASEVEVKITSLKDSGGGDIEDEGTTTDTTLTISGTATDGEVKLLDGDNPTPIETFTAAEGTWGGEIELTAGKTYVLKAEDADGEKSETHTVTVSEASEVEVKITSLKDSGGGDIEDDGTTTDTKLTISGTATDGAVKLLSGTEQLPIKTFLAAEGTWGGEIELPAGKTYVLKAEDVDGEESATYTVTVSDKPEVDVKITRLADKTGEVVHESVTPDTQLTITGTASSSTVEVFDNDEPEPIKTIPVVDGTWSGELDLSNHTRHVLTAKTPAGIPSKPLGFYIGESKPPEITRVLEHGEDGKVVENGGVTTSRHLWVRGDAQGHFRVTVWSGELAYMRASVTPGGWEDGVDLRPGDYELIAKTPAGVDSETPYRITVLAPENPE